MKRRREIRDLRTHPLKNDRFRPWSLPTAHRSALLDSAQPFPLHEVPMRVIGLAVVLAVSLTLAAQAQQMAMPVIGFLGNMAPGSFNRAALDAFRQGLSAIGFVEGQNVAIEYRWAEGHYDRLPTAVADLVGRKVDALVSTVGPVGALAAKRATATIPIVFFMGDDPVERGLVASLARPGGNLTGVSILTVELMPKQLDAIEW